MAIWLYAEGGAAGADPTGYLRADGRRLVDEDGETVMLRGIGVSRAPGLDIIRAREDLLKAAALGANSVRLDIDPSWFAGDTAPGAFDFIDSFVMVAARQNLRVILSMDWRPADDFTDEPGWEDPEQQEELVGLWMTIARRYRDRPEIGAYQLIRAPAPESAREYAFFIQYLIDSVREADTEHLILVSEPKTGNGLFEFDGVQLVYPIDRNLAYTFSEYEPEAFTRQGLDDRPEGIVWPGDIVVSVTELGEWSRRAVQDSVKSTPLKIEAIAPDHADYVAPRVYVLGVGRGRFERILLEEVAVFQREPGDLPIFSDTFSAIQSLWHIDPPGGRVMLERGAAAGEGSLILESKGTMLTAQPFTPLDARRIPKATVNRRYRLTARVYAGETAEAGIGLVFLSEDKYFSEPRDLRARLQDRIEWSRKANAPILLTEFAAPKHAPDHMEIQWMNAVVSACETYGVSWQYRTMREYDDPASLSDRQVYGLLFGPADAPADSFTVWPELQNFLLQSYKVHSFAEETLKLVESHLAEGSPANPVSPPAAGCWVGAQVQDSPLSAAPAGTFDAIMDMTRKLGRLPAWVPVFRPWANAPGEWTAFPEDHFRDISAGGSTPFLTWESRWGLGEISSAMVLEGYADTYIRDWADAARRYGKPFLLRLTRGIESSAYRHVQSIFDARGVTNISWMWSPAATRRSAVPAHRPTGMSDAQAEAVTSAQDTTHVEDFDWPWDSRVDWIGLGVYDRPTPGGDGEAEGLFPAAEVRAQVDAVRKFHTPICLAEIGCESIRGQAEWWVDALRKLQTPDLAPIRAIVLMESPLFGGAAQADFTLRSGSLYFIHKELANPYFVGGD